MKLPGGIDGMANKAPIPGAQPPPLETNGRCARARLDGFGFDLPPYFGHCGSLFAKPARTNAHPTSLLNGQTQIRHSVQGGHILTLFA